MSSVSKPRVRQNRHKQGLNQTLEKISADFRWNKKPHIRKWWKTPLDLIREVEDVQGFKVDYLHKEHYETYARLQINESQDHYDPSDHIIISHAITNRMPLISADTRFPWYKNQGLDLIYNREN